VSVPRARALAGTGAPRWSPATRVAFRFALVYLGLFALATQITGSLLVNPFVAFRGFGQLPPMRDISLWVATHIFGAAPTIDYTGSNGETIFFVAQTAWILAVALAATAVWSALDRHRTQYVALHGWFRLFIRMGLAAVMFEYGMTKVIPNQFAAPSLNIMVTPAGDLSLNTLFWTAVGASPGYQMATGWAELLAGILLLVPRTTVLGALVCLLDMVYVFTLNMTFDVGLKITSLHLVLLCLFLLVPEWKRLAGFFLLDRATEPSTQPPLFRTPRANRLALVVPILYGVYLLGMQGYANEQYWYAAGGGAPKSPLVGVWNVETLDVDGTVRPPSANDYDRQWRRVIFDRPDSLAVQRIDDSFARFGVSVDLGSRTLTLAKGQSRTWRSVFRFERPAADRLVLDGDMDGHRMHVELELVPLDSFRLVNSYFRWIRPDGG